MMDPHLNDMSGMWMFGMFFILMFVFLILYLIIQPANRSTNGMNTYNNKYSERVRTSPSNTVYDERIAKSKNQKINEFHYCTSCGSQNALDATFCKSCGLKLL